MGYAIGMEGSNHKPAVSRDGLEPVLLEALERERARVADALRSETAQVLATVLVGLTAALESDDIAEVREIVGDVRAAVREDLQRVQDLAATIRPSVLDDFGLMAALRSFAASLDRKATASIEVTFTDTPSALAPTRQGLVFRALAEALRNAVQHAQASSIRVSVTRAASELLFEVLDDGCGFDAAGIADQPNAGLGLALMRAQARALGGSLEIDSKPGAGTRLALRLPKGEPNYD